MVNLLVLSSLTSKGGAVQRQEDKEISTDAFKAELYEQNNPTMKWRD